jgi:hypothetical protein
MDEAENRIALSHALHSIVREDTIKNSWAGLDLPEGLTSDRAETAAQIIHNYEKVDFDGPSLDGVISRGELVIRLYCALCGRPKSPSA